MTMVTDTSAQGREHLVLRELIDCLADQLQLLHEVYETGFLYEHNDDGSREKARSLTLFELKDIHSVEGDLSITLGLLTDLYNNLSVAKTKGMIFWLRASPSMDLSWVDARLTLDMKEVIEILQEIADDLVEIAQAVPVALRQAQVSTVAPNMEQRFAESDMMLRAN